MLAFKEDGAWTEWTGQLLSKTDDPTFYQLHSMVEQLWPDEDLAEYGMKRVRAAVTPPGYQLVGYSLADEHDAPVQIGVYEALPPPSVPAQVTRAQGETALYANGLYEQYEALIQNHPYPPVRIWAKGASTWQRVHPYIAAMASEMVPPLSDEQIDSLFTEAATYEG